jgi:hypothetical protein
MEKRDLLRFSLIKSIDWDKAREVSLKIVSFKIISDKGFNNYVLFALPERAI